MRIEWLDECVSTNTQVTEYPLSEEGVIVAARCQTGGRGQKGNSWEAQPGKNLTFSAMWKPRGIAAREQFSISEAVALAVVDFLEDAGINAKVKWPNDIYVDDRKICGILIEHSVMGTEISRTIAGVGINVNQREFLSGAPNPVSMASIAGTEFPTERLLDSHLRAYPSTVRIFPVFASLSLIKCKFNQIPPDIKNSTSLKAYLHVSPVSAFSTCRKPIGSTPLTIPGYDSPDSLTRKG